MLRTWARGLRSAPGDRLQGRDGAGVEPATRARSFSGSNATKCTVHASPLRLPHIAGVFACPKASWLKNQCPTTGPHAPQSTHPTPFSQYLRFGLTTHAAALPPPRCSASSRHSTPGSVSSWVSLCSSQRPGGDPVCESCRVGVSQGSREAVPERVP